MIETPTVLIVGAGGSVPYGYPVGTKLREYIIQNASKLQPYVSEKILNENPDIVKGPAFDESHRLVEKFRSSFKLSHMYSIDAFLERNQQFLEIGKAAIAYSLLGCQNIKSLFSEGEWYQYLFNRLATPTLDELESNNLTIVTFNYDVSLERYLRVAIQNLYNTEELSYQAASEIQKRCIPIVHLYGSLSEMEEYVVDRTVEIIHRSAQNIKILGESERLGESREFGVAHSKIRTAKKIVFAGFGFDATNVGRLQIDAHFSGKNIYASAYGFTDAMIGEYIFWPIQKLWSGKVNSTDTKDTFYTEWRRIRRRSNGDKISDVVSTNTLPQAFDDCGMLFD